MYFRKKPFWCLGEELKDRDVTSEHHYLGRRSFLKKAFGISSGLILGSPIWKASEALGDFAYPKPDRSPTDEKLVTTYNNFYEFSLDKNEVHKKVEAWKLGSWTVEIGGLVDHPKTWDVGELIKKIGVEDRTYRFRCVEAWSMVVPWRGFMLQKLMSLVGVKSSAKYVRFETFSDRKIGTNMNSLIDYPWPYTEGLTIEEAKHPLTLLATGMYGKELPKQNGAPIRLIVPWKYGFKSIKSIVKIHFTNEKPMGLWEKLAPKEYGFYANVNPKVSHPRWTQSEERVIDGSFFPKKIATLAFNGYEKEVADLYKGLDLKKFY